MLPKSNTAHCITIVTSLTFLLVHFFLIATTRSFIYYLQFYEVYTIIENYVTFNLSLRVSQLRLQPSNPPIIVIIIMFFFPSFHLHYIHCDIYVGPFNRARRLLKGWHLFHPIFPVFNYKFQYNFSTSSM